MNDVEDSYYESQTSHESSHKVNHTPSQQTQSLDEKLSSLLVSFKMSSEYDRKTLKAEADSFKKTSKCAINKIENSLQ